MTNNHICDVCSIFDLIQSHTSGNTASAMPFLCSIAEIRMGATLRGRDATRPDPNGSYLFLRIGDISHDGVLLNDDLLRIEPNEPINPRACLCTGDVLFSNRGARTTAFVFHALETRTIVGPQFFIIRADKNLILPEYLAWFLRSAPAAEHFKALKKGTHVPIIDRRDLATLPIPVPPFSKQQQIAEVTALALQERQLTERLLQLRWQFANEQLIQIAQNSSSPLTSLYEQD
jgi:hypothetical protein